MTIRTRSISYKLHSVEQRLCMGVVMLCAALVSLYIYFVGKSIVNVVVREETELRIGEVNSLLSELEREYLTKKDAMSMKFAEEKGYYPISHKLFVNRGTFVGRSLSQDNNEI